MRRYLRPHYLFVFGGIALGLSIGIFVIDFEPAFVGWIFGGGIGLSGGAYLAAITSGEPLAGSASDQRRANWTLDELYGSEDTATPSPTSEGNGNGNRPS
ncbi:MAG: hypothetical protein HOH95_05450 [Dehalococcoidia bacterium]|jgi:hypothetical protein|nr:hypothetical protein [Dehalococcoidia bacterium]